MTAGRFLGILGLYVVILFAINRCVKEAFGAPLGHAPAKTLYIYGDVDSLNAAAFNLATTPLLGEPVKLLPSKDVVVSIATYGGDLDSMNTIIGRIKLLREYGYNVRCHAVVAYSAGFMIWMACAERTALAASQLMFHYPYRVFRGPITYKDAEEMASDLRPDQEAFHTQLVKDLGMTDAEVKEAAEASRIWSGYALCQKAKGFCTIVDNILL